MFAGSIGLMLLSFACEQPSPGVEDEVAGSESESEGTPLQIPVIGRALDPPAAAGSLAPNLTVVDDEIFMTWLQPFAGENGATSHEFLVSRLRDEKWSDPVRIADGSDFFANWADTPNLIAASNGRLFAHWLQKTADDTYAYSIRLSSSRDSGSTWQSIGWLNQDQTATEHGFVSYVPEGEGIRAFWLDGRAMTSGGAMALRTALVSDEVTSSEILDDRVCECCSLDSTLTDHGPVVVFRDRSEEEIRDVAMVRWQSGAWSDTKHINQDEWTIPGCPVNGPVVDASGSDMVVAWFTGAQDRPRVQAVFSADGGESFGTPAVIDSDRTLGRVDTMLLSPQQALVSWMAVVGDRAQILVRRVDSNGEMGLPAVLATTRPSRSSGVPRMAELGDRVFIAWVDADAESGVRVRLREVELTELPEIQLRG